MRSFDLITIIEDRRLYKQNEATINLISHLFAFTF